ncbi:MAG: hypothetical protein JSV93_00055 [Candidatus Omnitrophota bacterium]|nr:MAG: hypothetical protein JSV93_00055 [Candidatus Omnitrophota bacterium]
MKKSVIPIVFIIWLVLWINFIARDFYKHGNFTRYKILARSNYEGKHAYTYGKHFYEFLKFAKNNIPEDAHYEFAGIEDLSLDSRRGIYYLYPRLKSGNPDYLLVYDAVRARKNGFKLHAKLDERRFVLRRH